MSNIEQPDFLGVELKILMENCASLKDEYEYWAHRVKFLEDISKNKSLFIKVVSMTDDTHEEPDGRVFERDKELDYCCFRENDPMVDVMLSTAKKKLEDIEGKIRVLIGSKNNIAYA